MSNDNTRKIYQLTAKSFPEVGRGALVVRSTEVFSDTIGANRYKEKFIALCNMECAINKVTLPSEWLIELEELTLHE